LTTSCHDCQHQHIRWDCPNSNHSRKASYCNKCGTQPRSHPAGRHDWSGFSQCCQVSVPEVTAGSRGRGGVAGGIGPVQELLMNCPPGLRGTLLSCCIHVGRHALVCLLLCPPTGACSCATGRRPWTLRDLHACCPMCRGACTCKACLRQPDHLGRRPAAACQPSHLSRCGRYMLRLLGAPLTAWLNRQQAEVGAAGARPWGSGIHRRS